MPPTLVLHEAVWIVSAMVLACGCALALLEWFDRDDPKVSFKPLVEGGTNGSNEPNKVKKKKKSARRPRKPPEEMAAEAAARIEAAKAIVATAVSNAKIRSSDAAAKAATVAVAVAEKFVAAHTAGTGTGPGTVGEESKDSKVKVAGAGAGDACSTDDGVKDGDSCARDHECSTSTPSDECRSRETSARLQHFEYLYAPIHRASETWITPRSATGSRSEKSAGRISPRRPTSARSSSSSSINPATLPSSSSIARATAQPPPQQRDAFSAHASRTAHYEARTKVVVRANPDLNSEQVATLPPGTIVHVLDTLRMMDGSQRVHLSLTGEHVGPLGWATSWKPGEKGAMFFFRKCQEDSIGKSKSELTNESDESDDEEGGSEARPRAEIGFHSSHFRHAQRTSNSMHAAPSGTPFAPAARGMGSTPRLL